MLAARIFLGGFLIAALAACPQFERGAGTAADNARDIFGTVWGPADQSPERARQPVRSRSTTTNPSPARSTSKTRPSSATSEPSKAESKKPQEDEPSLGGAERPDF